MKNMMKKFISCDYDRGLGMLEELTLTGSINTSLQVDGITKTPEIHWIGVQNTIHLSEIGDAMKKDMARIRTFVAGKDMESQAYLSFYTKVNFKTDIYTYIAAVSLSKKDYMSIKGTLPEWILSGINPATEAFQVTHK